MLAILASAERKVLFAFLCFDNAPQNRRAGAALQIKWNFAWERFRRCRACFRFAKLERRSRAFAPFWAVPDCGPPTEGLVSSLRSSVRKSNPYRNPFRRLFVPQGR